MKLSEIHLTNTNERLTSEKRTVLLQPDELSPYAAYLTLQGLFGEPNGDFDDGKSQWAYELKVTNAILDIYDWKLVSWDIGVYANSGDEEEARKIGQEFIDFLYKEAQKYNNQIKEASAKTDSFILQNPFSLYYRSANNLINNIKYLNSKNQELSINFNFIEEEDICRSAFFLFIASFEGLLNLIYELYLKPELRDERIYDRLSREQIDIKVKLAPVYCSCFKSNLINSANEAFKNFHSLINLRNDFIHANLTKSMKTPVIIENQCTFILSKNMQDKLGLPKNISYLRLQDLLIVKRIIDEMIDILIQEMKPRYKRDFRLIMDNNFMHIEIEDGEIMIVDSDDYIA